MKLHIIRLITPILLLFCIPGAMAARQSHEIDSLLRVLDRVIENRDIYLQAKEKRISVLKMQRNQMRSDREIFAQNTALINEYESFVCDSAKHYLNENMLIAKRLRDSVMIAETAIRMALVHSMGGQFVEAKELFDKIDYNSLPGHLQALFGWAKVKYLGNMILSADEERFRNRYAAERSSWRDSLVNMFSVDSDLYRKEVAARYQEMGNYKAALPIYLDVFNKNEPETHEYAMMSKGMADLFNLLGENEEYKR